MAECMKSEAWKDAQLLWTSFFLFSGIRQLLKTHSADAQEHLSCDLAWLGRKCEDTTNAGNSAEVRLNLFEQIVMDF